MEEDELSNEDLADMFADAVIYNESGLTEVRIGLDHVIGILSRLLEKE